jgi:3-oxoacyl-[acyl-carrier protein] reductase
MITGGASGIGRAIARRYVAEGARVAVVDRNVDLLADVADELGSACLTAVADVTMEDDVAAAVATTVGAFGRLDVGVNCAGYATFGAIADLDVAAFRDVIDVCLTGVFLSVKHQARHLMAQGEGGSIISIASLNAVQPAEGMSAYCSAKAAVAMLTQVAAMELGPHGIRVNAIAPGLIRTPLAATLHDVPAIYDEFVANTPLGRSGTVQDVAAVASFLASDDSTWMTGDLLLVDGGGHTKRYPELPKIMAGLMPDAPVDR